MVASRWGGDGNWLNGDSFLWHCYLVCASGEFVARWGTKDIAWRPGVGWWDGWEVVDTVGSTTVQPGIAMLQAG